ncbi:hypothetical protein SAMN05444354_107347 [Stigmatella aurantiaca]|uniref:Uncharacterized protein n=1 Tax=Stigmatella aurantiaca TaxID=41 RepID=A0A1H7S7H4_STIAU|nr:hypothetical protein [Stigmatella aurantiaca]SEL68485.1 hypothetical protein SAMN05444354_107347 [Stigmatella aurantiaca]
MGTPRTGGVHREPPKHRFKEEEDAMQLLLRRRSQSQIDALCATGNLAPFQARTFAWVHRNREWLLSGDYLRAPPDFPPGLGGTDTSRLTAMLGPQMSLLLHGDEVGAAYRELVQAGQRLHAAVNRFYEQHPWAKEHTRLWQSEQRLFCAFAMLTVEAENMGPKLSPQEMEALALLVGIREPGEEFEQDPKSNEQRQAAWKEMMKDVVESGVLPLLRSIATQHRPPEMVAMPPPASPAQQVVSMPSTPTEPLEQLVTTSPAQPTSISPEQFKEDEGDKK